MKKSIKFIAAAFTFGLFGNTLFGSENFKFSITPTISFLNGHLYEYVFDENLKNEKNMLSMLDWEFKNIPYGELNCNIDIFKYLNLSFTGKSAISVFSGSMQDYDWQNYSTPTQLTNYSIHTNLLYDYYSLHLAIGGNILNTEKFYLCPFFSYDYDYLLFDAYDGYREYASDNWKRVYCSGKIISYFQEYDIFGFGLKAAYKNKNKWILSSSFMISPKLSSANALDFHYLRDFNKNFYNEYGELIKTIDTPSTLFYDKLDKVVVIKGNFSFLYNISKHSSFSSIINYHIIPTTKGTDYMTGTNLEKEFDENYFVEAGIGGTSSFLWSLGISYTYSF